MTNSRDELDVLARRLLAGFSTTKVNPTRIDRGESNRVWVTDDLVLRLSSFPESKHLIRESKLAELLPAQVGYPRVLGSGTEDSLEWIVTELIPGEQLEAKWPMLNDTARVRAVESLWMRLEWVKQTNVARAQAIGCTHTPFYALNEKGAAGQLRELSDKGFVDAQMHRDINRILERLFAAIGDVPVALNHTDAGLHNTIWNDPAAIPIDFEFACVGPIDLDLEMLLRQLLESAPTIVSIKLVEFAQQHLERPGSRHRLIGYAVLRDVWGLLLWHHYADSFGPDRNWPPLDVELWDPLLRLRAHAQGKSRLAEVWS